MEDDTVRRLRSVLGRVRDQGASAVEYGLMVAAIAAVIVGVVFGFGNLIHGAFSQTSRCIVIKQSPNNC